MTSLETLGIAVLISLALSAALCLVIFRPLQSLLMKACPGPEAVQFWGRFSLVMLFLSPLFVSVAFALPAGDASHLVDAGVAIEHIISTALVGAFLAMLGMGLWVSALMRRIPLAAIQSPGRDREKWGE